METIEEMVDSEQAEQKEADMLDDYLEISINGHNGIVGHNTLRIHGSLKGRPLSISLYSGSTHNSKMNKSRGRISTQKPYVYYCC